VTRWSACIEMLFQKEHPDFHERIFAAKDAGFDAVEFWATSNKLPLFFAIEGALEKTGVTVAAVSAEPALQLADPANRRAYVEGLPKAIEAAQRLGAKILIATVGQVRDGVPRAEQHKALVDTFNTAADVVAGTGIVLAVEPLNDRVDHKGYYLTSTTEGLDIVDEVGRPEVKLLYDIYHSAVMGEDTPTVLSGRVDRIAHVHLADAPGRHEPGSGTMDWQARVAWLEAQGYRGRVGLEYRPKADTTSSLLFRNAALDRAR
jgi:hydroxypyruvate isomerase